MDITVVTLVGEQMSPWKGPLRIFFEQRIAAMMGYRGGCGDGGRIGDVEVVCGGDEARQQLGSKEEMWLHLGPRDRGSSIVSCLRRHSCDFWFIHLESVVEIINAHCFSSKTPTDAQERSCIEGLSKVIVSAASLAWSIDQFFISVTFTEIPLSLLVAAFPPNLFQHLP
ncbi:hypothetical protein Tco_0513428 [Tanacetum coccineum]